MEDFGFDCSLDDAKLLTAKQQAHKFKARAEAAEARVKALEEENRKLRDVIAAIGSDNTSKLEWEHGIVKG